MGHFENVDEVSHLNSALLELPAEPYRNAMEDIIKSYFGVKSNECEIAVDAASAKGDNYIGVLYRVAIKSKGKELKVIVKLPPANQARRDQFFARPCFLRESLFYDELQPLFEKFQTDKGIVVEKEGFNQVAICFKSLTEELFEGLFMEDVKVSGFEMFDRFKEATADHVNLVMRALAKYHAISLAIKDQKPKLLEPYTDMQDIFLQRDDAGREQISVWFDMLKKQASDTIAESTNEGLKAKAEEFLKADFFNMLAECIDGKAAQPYTVVCHGDCWNNNIMFRYENGVPVEIRLLDWQIMRYSSPVCDLMYYIFGCTTKKLRDNHYNEFLDTYHNTLSSFLKRLGSEPSKVFPREAFNDHLVRFGRFGLAMAIMVLPIFTSNAEDTPDMDEMAEKFKDMQENGGTLEESDLKFSSEKTIGVYMERMSGVFNDMYDLGYI